MNRRKFLQLAAFDAGAPVHPLKKIIEFNERHRDRELALFGQETVVRAQTVDVCAALD